MKKILIALTRETSDVMNSVKQTNKYPQSDLNILLLINNILQNIDHKYLSIIDPKDNLPMNFISLKEQKTHDIAKSDDLIESHEYFIVGNNIAAYYTLIHNNYKVINKGPELKLINSKAIDVDFEHQDKNEFIDSLKANDWLTCEVWKNSQIRLIDVDEISTCPNCKSKVVITPTRNKKLINNENILVTIMNNKIISLNSDFESKNQLEQFNINVNGLRWEAVYLYVDQYIMPYVNNNSVFIILDVIKDDTHYGLDLSRIISFIELSDDLATIPSELITNNLHFIVDEEYNNANCKANQIKLAMAEFKVKVDNNIIDPFKLPSDLIKQNNYKIVNEKSDSNENVETSVVQPGFDPECSISEKIKIPEQTFLKENKMFINECYDSSCTSMNVNDQSYDRSSSNKIINDERSETHQEFSDSKNDYQNHEKNKIFNHSPNDHSAGQSENEPDTKSYNYVKFKQKDYDRAIKIFKEISIEHNITEDNSIFYTIYKGGIPLTVRYFNQLNITESKFGILSYQRFDGPKNQSASVELLSPHITNSVDIKNCVILEDLIDSGKTLEQVLDFFNKYIKDFNKYKITIFCIHASYEALDLINMLPFDINIIYYNLKTKNDWITYPWE